MGDRNIETDLKWLVKIHNKCFKLENTEIPLYNGQEVKPSIYNNGLISDNINGEKYQWHIDNDRNLGEILLAMSYNLGYDACLENEIKMRDALIETQRLLIEKLSK